MEHFVKDLYFLKDFHVLFYLTDKKFLVLWKSDIEYNFITYNISFSILCMFNGIDSHGINFTIIQTFLLKAVDVIKQSVRFKLLIH